MGDRPSSMILIQIVKSSKGAENNEKYEWFLSSNINDAEIILGDKEFNFMRLKELYQKDTHDKSKLNLVIELYVYFSDFEKSCFYKTLPQQTPQVAYAYEYVK